MSPRNLQHFFSDSHAQELLCNLCQLRDEGTFCDITLTVSGCKFMAHRSVLAGASLYFKAMLTGHLAEADKPDVELHGVNSSIFKLFLDYLYTGAVDVTQDNCQDLLVAANMFQLPQLMAFCAYYLQHELHLSNCLDMHQFANLYACGQLKETTEKFIHLHFLKVSQKEEFLEIPRELLLWLIQSEYLHIDNEYQVFSAAMKWILHNPPERRKDIFEILSHIRFPLISHNKIEKFIETCKDLSVKVVLQKFLQDSKQKKQPDGYQVTRNKPFFLYPRECARKTLIVYGGYYRTARTLHSGFESISRVYQFDCFRQQWKPLPYMKQSRERHGACIFNGLIFAIGGQADRLIQHTVEYYRPGDSAWTHIAPMVHPRSDMGLAVYSNYLYLFGGCDGPNITDSIDRYCPEEASWEQIGHMTSPRYAMGVLQHQGLVYVIGGKNDLDVEQRQVESFNPTTREWTRLADLNTPRARASVAVLDGAIYVVGGELDGEGMKSVERYSIEQNVWSTVQAMPTARSASCSAAVNGLLYVVGGCLGSSHGELTLPNVECYDPETDTWTCLKDMPGSVGAAGMVVMSPCFHDCRWSRHHWSADLKPRRSVFT